MNQKLRLLGVVAHPHDYTHFAGTSGVHTTLGDRFTIVCMTTGTGTHNVQLSTELAKPPTERNQAIKKAIETEDCSAPLLQMLSNYQHLEKGGSEYMRLIVCDPSKGTVSVSTYSPHLDAYLTDMDNQFDVTGISLGPVLEEHLNT